MSIEPARANEAEQLLTLKESVEELDGKVSSSTLYNAVERKELPHYRVSGSGKRGKILIRRADLWVWLESQRVEPPGAPAVHAGGDGFTAYYQRVMEEVARKERRG